MRVSRKHLAFLTGASLSPLLALAAEVDSPRLTHDAPWLIAAGLTTTLAVTTHLASLIRAAENNSVATGLSAGPFDPIDDANDITLVVGDNNAVLLCSPAAEELLAMKPSAAVADRVVIDDHPTLNQLLHGARSGRRPVPVEIRVYDEFDGIHWLEATAVDMRHNVDVGGIVVTARDITERKELEIEGNRSRARFVSLVTHATDVIAVIDGTGVISYISPSCHHVFGYPPERLVGRNVLAFAHSADSKQARQIIENVTPETSPPENPQRFELRFRNKHAQSRVLEIAITDMRHDPAVAGIVLNAHDVTDRKELEEDLRHQVLHDSLTGIGNRVLFRDRAGHALAKRHQGRITAALFIDLDDFKTVNDGLGHGVGDELLKVIAFRLSSSVREADTTARLGGDEFAVLLEDMESVEDVHTVAENLIKVLAAPLDSDGHEIGVTASIGIAVSHGTSDVDVLLRNADVAMYHAKSAGKACFRVFDESMHESALQRLELKADLVHAVERNELRLFYQPLVNLVTGEVKGFEALVRWEHPRRGMLSPDLFIPLAEETGLILPIGSWVLEEATRQLGVWLRRFPGWKLTMSVNVSPVQLTEDGVVDRVERALSQAGLEPESVVLELTESAVLDDAMGRERLRQLGHLGVGIAADDFGSGFASYAALQQLPFTMLKIDRSLLGGLSTTLGRAEAQLHSIIEMAHATGVKVVAEGIEDEAQLHVLQSMNCDIGQGYLFGRPTTVLEIEEILGADAAASPA